MNFDRGVAINIIDHNGDIVKKLSIIKEEYQDEYS